MTIEETLQSTRKQFFAYRNGIVADTLRKNGDPHSIIMGCQLSDIVNISHAIKPSTELAEAFWADTKHRECRIIATMLYPAEEMEESAALAWCSSVECYEIADVLCHRLLRHLPYAQLLIKKLLETNKPMAVYIAFRLLLNLQILGKVEPSENLKALVEKYYEGASPQLTSVLDNISEDL